MRVIVVGGGFAGFAAAIVLQERRHEVVLLERRGILGGRATSSRDAVTGDDVDNGTHLMVGAYSATLDLLRRAGADDLLQLQQDLQLEWVDERGTTALSCPPLLAPLHLLLGLAGLRVPLAVKLQAIRLGLAVRFGRRPDGLTLAEYFRRTGQGEAARRLVWDPLAIAILNEPVERAAAVLFHRVYQEAFLRDHRASRLVFPRRGWGVLMERVAAYFESRGGRLWRGARAESADAVVSAVPPPALLDLLPEELRARPAFEALERFQGSPIVSVDLWLDRVVVDRLMLGLRAAEMEWVFDKGRLHGREGAPQHLAFIVSAAYRSAPKTNAELVEAAVAALQRYFPAMAGASVTRSLVQREAQATFASTPELEALRPGPVSDVAGLFLAGDWTDTGLPATIEGAVRSGLRAADALRSQTPDGA
jgi:uncharacterized protein with NAD-binding domain and iron-sulfur cluster